METLFVAPTVVPNPYQSPFGRQSLDSRSKPNKNNCNTENSLRHKLGCRNSTVATTPLKMISFCRGGLPLHGPTTMLDDQPRAVDREKSMPIRPKFRDKVSKTKARIRPVAEKCRQLRSDQNWPSRVANTSASMQQLAGIGVVIRLDLRAIIPPEGSTVLSSGSADFVCRDWT
jgi:hypothetical protein